MDIEQMKSLPEKEQEKLYKKLKASRSIAKTLNYSSIYNVGAKTLGKILNISEVKAKGLLEAYWKRNWSVKEVSNNVIIKYFYKHGGKLTFSTCKGKDIIPQDNDTWKEKKAKNALVNSMESMWLFNPVSELWYSLRFPRDIFSTLNQGTGSWVFDTFVKHIRKESTSLIAQMHDRFCRG